ncbi:hypothetical protein MKY09_09650 [Psychrobacillus sp. FSL K6-4046]
MMDKKEITYFEKIEADLEEAYQRLSEDINNQDQNYKELQKYTIEYKNELDKFEVYDYQQTLNMIDKQGLAQVLEREQIKKLIESPYFGRFDFVYNGEEQDDAETF